MNLSEPNHSLASDLLVRQLVVEGITNVFGRFSTGNLPLLHALTEHKNLHYVPALHEGVAVSMAIGYSHASGRPSVVHISGISGTTSSLSAITNAAQDRIGLVILAEEDALHSLSATDSPNVLSLVASSCQWTCEVKDKDQIARITRRAFYEAMSPPRGPVFLWFPNSIIKQTTSEPVIVPPKLSPSGGADSTFLKKAAQLLISAKKPAVLVGNEISQYRARKEAVSLVEVLACPAFSEAMPVGINFPNQHPLFLGLLPTLEEGSSNMLSDYDVILVVGVQHRQRLPEGLIPDTTVVIQLNTHPCGYTLPCHFSASADIAESLSKLRAELQLLVDNQWVANAKLRTANLASWVKAKRKTLELNACPTHGPSIPLRVFLRLLDSLRPKKSTIVNDLGSYAKLPLQAMNFESSTSYCGTNGEAPGWGLSAALGLQLASPDYTVICLTSDTSLLSQPQGLWTASHYNLAVKTIVLNRQRYDLLWAKSLGCHNEATKIEKPLVQLVELANSLGVPANSVASMSAVERALVELIEARGPYLLDVHTG
ncbi:MAG: thiamine pyrophosphate-binding protein [Candidatus Melainabacteria bacterium]|nr:thiamine pyrophosphate-binding protein [Candidatus Melainabacteria bacterium]